jgi:hypothetical protein
MGPKLQHWKDLGKDWRDPAATVQSIVTIVALLIGGVWTYNTFVRFRQDRPRLVITHSVDHFRIPNNLILLSVEERFSNVGPVAIELQKGEIRIIRVLPLPDGLAQKAKSPDSLNDTAEDPKVWPVLVWYPHPWDKTRELIEPGEADSIKNYFLIPDSIEVVNIVSFVANPAEGNKMAWRSSTTYDLRSESGATSARSKDALNVKPPDKPNGPRSPKRKGKGQGKER